MPLIDAQETVPEAFLRTILKSQFHAALAMLRPGIEHCPDELWDSDRYPNRHWQIAYHALFFAHFYLSRDANSFRPWTHHQAECQYPDGIPGPVDAESDLPVGPSPYTKEQVLEYWTFCDELVDPSLDEADLNREESGFYWYPIPKLEHLLVNIRHIQHHAAQLADRLRSVADYGVEWAGARRPSP